MGQGTENAHILGHTGTETNGIEVMSHIFRNIFVLSMFNVVTKYPEKLN